MRIIIDYDGSVARCGISRDGKEEPCPFNDADNLLQSMAMTAFKTVEKEFRRNQKQRPQRKPIALKEYDNNVREHLQSIRTVNELKEFFEQADSDFRETRRRKYLIAHGKGNIKLLASNNFSEKYDEYIFEICDSSGMPDDIRHPWQVCDGPVRLKSVETITNKY